MCPWVLLAEVKYIEISIFNNKLDWSNPDYNLRTQMDPYVPGQQITSFQYQRKLKDKLWYLVNVSKGFFKDLKDFASTNVKMALKCQNS